MVKRVQAVSEDPHRRERNYSNKSVLSYNLEQNYFPELNNVNNFQLDYDTINLNFVYRF